MSSARPHVADLHRLITRAGAFTIVARAVRSTPGMSNPFIQRSRVCALIVRFSLPCLALLFATPNSVVGQAQRDATMDPPFQVGDRVVVSVQGEPALTDTFTVREGLILRLPTLPDIKLAGVSRAGIQSRVASAVAEYYRNREVHAATLVRIAVLGQVLRPGYYELSVDATMSDAIMTAGGPTAAANADNIVVRRVGVTMYAPARVRELLAHGATVTDAGIRSGDEIFVEDRQRRDWATVAQIAATLSTVVLSVIYAAHR